MLLWEALLLCPATSKSLLSLISFVAKLDACQTVKIYKNVEIKYQIWRCYWHGQNIQTAVTCCKCIMLTVYQNAKYCQEPHIMVVGAQLSSILQYNTSWDVLCFTSKEPAGNSKYEPIEGTTPAKFIKMERALENSSTFIANCYKVTGQQP